MFELVSWFLITFVIGYFVIAINRNIADIRQMKKEIRVRKIQHDLNMERLNREHEERLKKLDS